MNIVHIDTLVRDLIYLEAEKIRRWAERANNNDTNLVNWCALCSYLIFKKLKKYNLDPEFCSVSIGYGSHCFVYCQGYIVDVTATQFRVKTKVVVRKNNGRHKLYYWNLSHSCILRFNDIDSIENYLKKWDESCQPKKFFHGERKQSRQFIIKSGYQRKCDALCA